MDQISIEEVDRLARRPNSVVIRSDICMRVRVNNSSVGWKWSSYSFYVCMGELNIFLLFLSMFAFQLWDEVEPGLPSGDVVGVPGSDLHLY